MDKKELVEKLRVCRSGVELLKMKNDILKALEDKKKK